MSNQDRKNRLSAEQLALLRKRSVAQGAIPRRPSGCGVPLTFAQKRLWFLDQFTPGSTAYNLPSATRLIGDLNVAALEQAFHELARRHESLRTTFPTKNGQPVQQISAEPEVSFTVTDAPAGDPAALDRLVTALTDVTFDLARGPLWRVHVFRVAPQEHLMLFVIHHIITDGWSFGVLRRELGHLYEAYAAGRTPELPPLPIQCADVACWEQDRFQSDELKEQLAYWQAKLAGDLPVVELPADHVRPAVQATDGASLQTVISPELTRALKNLCQEEKATLYSGLLAAFAALLHRYTGLTDLPVGTPVFGRSRSELEALIGYFANTLVLRLDLTGPLSFRELLRRVHATTVEAVGRQEVPFERLVEILKPQRDLAVPPLFQVLFSLVRTTSESMTWAGLTMDVYEIPKRSAHYDLTLEAFELGDELRLGWFYRSDLFEAGTVARWAGHLQTLLASALAAPDQPVNQAELLPAAERELLLSGFNATAMEFDRTATIHGLFERQAARTPDATAAVWEGEAVTYAELNRSANRLAHHLRAQGVGPEQLVGIRLERGLPMLVTLLAVLKAGGAYVPLDPAYPAERLAFMAEDAQLAVIIDEAYLAGVTAGGAEREENPAGGAGPEHPCYAIYTSGSTGRPKGAVVLHRNVVNFLLSMQREPGLTPADTLLAVTSISFDIAGLELFLPLVTGARVVIASRAAAGDGEALAALLARHGVTVMQATPVTWRLLLDAGWRSRPGFTMLCGGEALPPELAGRLTAEGGALWNMYGPTETTIWSTVYPVAGVDGPVPIGRPIANTQVYVLDEQLQPVPIGVAGELYIGGEGVIRGYWNRPELTRERFVDLPQGRVYRTGDLARWRADGVLEYLGRTDFQVKLRGHRLELGEIEAALARLPGVTGAVVVARGTGAAMKLVAYITGGADPAGLRGLLKEQLPEYMVPAVIIPLEAFPLTPNGKVDRKALPDPRPVGPTAGFVAPGTDVERTIASIWADVLGIEQVGTRDNFFELGGHSLLVVQVRAQLKERLGIDLPVMDLFRYTTVAALAAHISGGDARTRRPAPAGRQRQRRRREGGDGAVAIIGMAGRFPGAPDVAALWQNLLDGVESIQTFTAAEDASGLSEEVPGYVRAGGFMEGVDRFDASFFGYGPREAATMDPQQRLFLEVAWEALERAGYDAAQYPGRIGVIAGAGMNNYWLRHLAPNQALMESVGGFPVMISNDKDFVATRVAYKLGLKGPALTVQTACSTSLAATAVAVQMLQAGTCEMALAGGVSLQHLDKFGYQYEQGSILSPDGHCRAFDEAAGGTVPGSGLGVVVLKLLEDAEADGDQIIAVIRGIAINNDGSEKIGYTGPSAEGQAEVIAEALAAADIHPDSVGYIETHGTGTALGDPIEVQALTQAYREAGATGTGKVALGAVKSNVGHLDIAAGVTGLIKAALVVRHGELPPTLHFRAPNPKLDLESSPFYVQAERSPWHGPLPRRAGVSSFGIGGTNVHAVLEEAPPQPGSGPGRPAELLLLSARTPEALAQATTNLSDWLKANPRANLADVAHTLQVGRRAFPFRQAVVAATPEEAAQTVLTGRPAQVEPGDRSVVLLFPGQGAQYPGMGRGLYATEPAYRDAVDRCAVALQPHLGMDIRTLLFPAGPDTGEQLRQTALAQPALFVTEYAMACLLAEWGIHPAAMIGHSLGEYVAACLAGVFRLEDALWLVAMRGKAMQAMEPGAMLALTLPEAEVTPLLTGNLSLAAVNGPSLCVVSGPTADIELLAQRVDGRRLHTSHAFHSDMMAPAAERFRQLVRRVALSAPAIPFVSNVTGTWITPEQATDPDYWARHLREPVRFGDGLLTLLEQPGRVLVETGPGQTLATFARQSSARAAAVATTMRHPQDTQSDTAALLQGVGRLWQAGVKLDGAGMYTHQRRHRVELPTYPFERQRYWIAPPDPARAQPCGEEALAAVAAALETEHARPALSTGFVAPRTEAEAQIAAVFARHLGVSQVGIHDDFFELGGHSLLAIRVLTEIRERLGVELSARSLYELPTVAAMADSLTGARAAEGIPAVPRDQPLPLSLAQERLWLLDRKFPEEAARNNLSLTYVIEGDVDVPLLEQCLKQIAARHEILRTGYAEVDGQPVQVIHPEIEWTVPVIDLTHLPPDERDAEMRRLAAEEDYRPFDLTRPPLLRITLLRLAAREHTLILLAHHSVFDGTSQNKLFHELTALMTGHPEELPDLPVQYADYAVWQRQRLQGEGLRPHLEYWQTKLGGDLPFVDLPTDHPRGGPAWVTEVVYVELPLELGAALKALALEAGSTLFTVMLAGFKALLALQGKADDVLVGTHFANRDRPEVDPIMGFFVNMVPLRTNLSGNPTFAELVERVKATAMGAFTHAEVPLALLLRELQPDLYVSHKRAIQFTMVQYAAGAQLTLPGTEFTQRLWVRKPMHDLALSAYDTPESFAVALEYDASLFDRDTVVGFLETYEAFLTAAVADPTRPIDKLVRT